MKKSFFLFFLLISKLSGYSQTMDIHFGVLTGNYFYRAMDSLALSYNNFYKNDAGGLVKEMEFKSAAIGWQAGTTFSADVINFSIDVSRLKSAVTRAEWSLGYNRGLQLKSYLFDLDVGFFVTPSENPFRLSVGLVLTLQSTHIESFFEFDKVRSYGSESSFNGVWASWKGSTPLVLKAQYKLKNERWSLFSTLRVPILSKKRVSFGYIYSSGFGSSYEILPAVIGAPTGLDNQLNENFRLVNLSVGIGYNFLSE